MEVGWSAGHGREIDKAGSPFVVTVRLKVRVGWRKGVSLGAASDEGGRHVLLPNPFYCSFFACLKFCPWLRQSLFVCHYKFVACLYT